MPFAFQQHAQSGDRPNRTSPFVGNRLQISSRTFRIIRAAVAPERIWDSTPVAHSHHMLACVRGNQRCTHDVARYHDPASPCGAKPHPHIRCRPALSAANLQNNVIEHRIGQQTLQPFAFSISHAHLSRWGGLTRFTPRTLLGAIPCVQRMPPYLALAAWLKRRRAREHAYDTPLPSAIPASCSLIIPIIWASVKSALSHFVCSLHKVEQTLH